MVSHTFDAPYINTNAKERAHALLNEDNIGKQRWCELTGFSEGQYYRWLGNTHAHSQATTAQVMHVCTVLNWSPTYIYYGLGPARLSECANVDLRAGVDAAVENNLLLREIMQMLKELTDARGKIVEALLTSLNGR